MQRFWNMQGLWNSILGLLRAFISFPFKKCTLFNTRLIFLCWSYKEIIFSLYRTEMNTLNRRAAWRAWPLTKLNVPVKIIWGVPCLPGPSPCYSTEKSVRNSIINYSIQQNFRIKAEPWTYRKCVTAKGQGTQGSIRSQSRVRLFLSLALGGGNEPSPPQWPPQSLVSLAWAKRES